MRFRRRRKAGDGRQTEVATAVAEIRPLRGKIDTTEAARRYLLMMYWVPYRERSGSRSPRPEPQPKRRKA